MRPPNPVFAKIRSDIPAIAWPPISSGQPAVLVAMLGQLEDSQWLAREEIAAMQLRQLAILAEHCRKYSPHFRKRLKQAGLTAQDIASAEGLRSLPVLRRRDLQNTGDLFCSEVPPGHAPLYEARTSGSTGEPVIVKRTNLSNFDWSVMTLREDFWHRRDFSKPFCAIRGQFREAVRGADWGLPNNLLFDTGPALGLPATMDVARQLELIVEFAPESLLVYPSNLAALMQACVSGGIALPTLRHIRTFGETLAPQLRADARRVFSATLTDNYSSQEIGYLACQCPDSQCPDAPLYHVMETVMVEILDEAGAPCRAGEIGRVVVTDLHNFATPLIRYDIGDYAEVGAPCPCGRGLPTIARILGRERNMVVLPDGRRIWPLMGADYLRLRDVAPIRQYQLIQQELGRMEVRLVSDRPLSLPEEDEIRAMIGKIFTYPFRVDFHYFEQEIPKGPTGKFEIFLSRVT